MSGGRKKKDGERSKEMWYLDTQNAINKIPKYKKLVTLNEKKVTWNPYAPGIGSSGTTYKVRKAFKSLIEKWLKIPLVDDVPCEVQASEIRAELQGLTQRAIKENPTEFSLSSELQKLKEGTVVERFIMSPPSGELLIAIKSFAEEHSNLETNQNLMKRITPSAILFIGILIEEMIREMFCTENV